jgi:hypothetical protein
MDHQLMPCEPVWLATVTGSVLASVLVSSAAKKYSFQHNTSVRMNAATIPGTASGNMIRMNAPQTDRPSTKAASSSSIGMALKLIAHDPDDDRKHCQGASLGIIDRFARAEVALGMISKRHLFKRTFGFEIML